MENSILAALPANERKRLAPFLHPVRLEIHQALIEPDQLIEYVYFPIDMVASIQAIRAGCTETGVIGYEGCIGVPVWLRQYTTPVRIFVQGSGTALRMPAEVLRHEAEIPESPLNALLASYTHCLLIMTSYTAVCHDAHTLQARLCRWIHMMQNRLRRPEFIMKQEFLASMLGVSRPTVSMAANGLQQHGWIRYRRARLEILDLKAIEDGACDCLRLIESLFRSAKPASLRPASPTA